MTVTESVWTLWDRLTRLSEHLLDDIGSRPHHDDDTWYVARDIEAALVQQLLSPGVEPHIVVGEAGHGKSTLLWSLQRTLTRLGRTPLLLSATWLQPGTDRIRNASLDDVVSAVVSRPDSILLLDTIDLLLHSPAARHNVIDLVETLSRANVPVVMTTRPLEGHSLPTNLGHKISLGPYSSKSELPAAITALTDEFVDLDSVRPAHPVAAIQSARARGALVEDVCTSPLFLRLLFSLSAPYFPHLELDVTGLYNLFWCRRIVSDHRTGADLPPDDADDLSATTGLLAIALLALGTPEPPIDVLIRWTAQVADSADRTHDAAVLRRHVQTLTRRGVLVTTHNRVRFLHRTFFEFAVAQGLAARGADGELPRLVERAARVPDDLLVGAVVEQTLIVLGADVMARTIVRASCRRLIGTGHPQHISSVMTVWAHHPDLLELTDDMVAVLTDEQLRRFLRTLPRVHGHTTSVAEHLYRLWVRRPELRPEIATTAAYLAGRDTHAIANLVSRTAMYADLAAARTHHLRSSSEPLTLLRDLTSTAPNVVRSAVLSVIEGLSQRSMHADKESGRKSVNTIARYVNMVAESWEALADDPFLLQLEVSVTKIQAHSNRRDVEVIRRAMGAVIAAHILRDRLENDWTDRWFHWVGEVCADLERRGSERDPTADAHLAAVGMALRQIDEPHHVGLIEATLATLFSLPGPTAPHRLADVFAREVLTTPSLARTSLIATLSVLLHDHLPVDDRNPAPGPAVWAAVTRQMLTDPSVPAEVIRDIVSTTIHKYSSDRRLFTRSDYLVALAPVAIVWGEPTAIAAADRLSRVDAGAGLDPRAAEIFLDHSLVRAHQRPELLVRASLAIAHRVGRPQSVADLLRHQNNHTALRAHAPLLERWTEQLMTGAHDSQASGAGMLRMLLRHNMILPSVDLLAAWLEQATSAEGTALLLRTIGTCSRRANSSTVAADLLTQFITTSLVPKPTVSPRTKQVWPPMVIDAARDALLETIARSPTSFSDQWPTVYALTFAPRSSGKTDAEGVRLLARFLRAEAETGTLDDAIAHLGMTWSALSQLNKKTRAKASHKLTGPVTAILRRAHDRHYDRLANLIRTTPTELTAQLIQGLLDSALFAERAQEFGDRLDLAPRVIASGTFKEVLVRHDSSAQGASCSSMYDESSNSAAYDERLIHALRRLEQRRNEFEQATDRAYRTIRRIQDSRDDAHLGQTLFSISRSAFYRLKAGTTWSAPGPALCAAVDAHGAAVGRQFGLAAAQRAYAAANQEADDARHARDRHR
ncbi:hypothetical protein HQO38_23655 [Rhodococcus fascians]|nr:hypothetical protein [Rhodococcus fascians]MBY4141143.1 hypothetical protein [Rhodococcus fascians]MBY4219667.1 hypothetical protein [Rhodococcus fascians]MBY4224741.1 hypothetical protein [Rhodococcus fascians]MBY4234906.1 hypothetical protein [Rhodococcus fascians]